MGDNFLLIEAISADCTSLLNSLCENGIEIKDVLYKNELTILFRVRYADARSTVRLVEKHGGKINKPEIIPRRNILQTLMKRPILMVGMLLICILTMILPTKVLFIRIEGNASMDERVILEQARECGIRMWASRREIRSEQAKNRLLEALPQLQWVGVNTYGCTAVISVKERQEAQNVKPGTGVSSIVAVRDGIIESCTAVRGNLLCKPGQAVKAGQTLISGYTDCGLTILAQRSEGEIYAQTMQQLQVVIPADWDKKGEITQTIKKYSLIIGKKRINFYKDSGILDTSCDKMYTSYVLTLPGGFALPVSLLVEEEVYRAVQPVDTQTMDVDEVARECAQSYLLQHMISGRILSSEITEGSEDGVYVLQGQYRCTEMIGRRRNEEIIQSNGKNS